MSPTPETPGVAGDSSERGEGVFFKLHTLAKDFADLPHGVPPLLKYNRDIYEKPGRWEFVQHRGENSTLCTRIDTLADSVVAIASLAGAGSVRDRFFDAVLRYLIEHSDCRVLIQPGDAEPFSWEISNVKTAAADYITQLAAEHERCSRSQVIGAVSAQSTPAEKEEKALRQAGADVKTPNGQVERIEANPPETRIEVASIEVQIAAIREKIRAGADAQELLGRL